MTSLTRRGALLGVGGALAMPHIARAQTTALKVSLNAPFDGSNAAFFLADQKGYYAKAGLQCQFDSSGGAVESSTRVGSGVYDFAFTDINVLTEFDARNPDHAASDVFMLYYRSPLCAISFRKAGITKPADLAGRTLGAAQTDGAYRLFPAFCKQTALDPGSVKWKTVDLRLRETLLLRGDVDAILGFDSTSYFNLVRAGAKPDDIAFLYYSDFGMPLYSNSLAASKKMIEGSPDVVKRFVAASAQGWRDAIADPLVAITALQKKDGLIDVKLEVDKLNWVIRKQIVTDESRAHGLGGVDPDRLARSLAIVKDAFDLPSVPSPGIVFNPGFLPPEDQRRLPA